MEKLSFEDFKKHYLKVDLEPESREKLEKVHNIDFDKEIESVAKQEYEFYLKMDEGE